VEIFTTIRTTNFAIPKPVWAVGFALEQTLRDATLAVFSFLILKRLQHKPLKCFEGSRHFDINKITVCPKV
jgi:hypothetical protein